MMMTANPLPIVLLVAGLVLSPATLNAGAQEKTSPSSSPKPAVQREKVQAKPHLDRSGKARKGKASYYNLPGRKRADGKPMNPNTNAAASKTLPLGTKAKVTNLETGKSAEVTIQDRGPYIKDRIVDVTPSTARKLDMKEQGVAPVEVKPLELPAPANTDKPGATRDPSAKTP